EWSVSLTDHERREARSGSDGRHDFAAGLGQGARQARTWRGATGATLGRNRRRATGVGDESREIEFSARRAERGHAALAGDAGNRAGGSAQRAGASGANQRFFRLSRAGPAGAQPELGAASARPIAGSALEARGKRGARAARRVSRGRVAAPLPKTVRRRDSDGEAEMTRHRPNHSIASTFSGVGDGYV